MAKEFERHPMFWDKNGDSNRYSGDPYGEGHLKVPHLGWLHYLDESLVSHAFGSREPAEKRMARYSRIK